MPSTNPTTTAHSAPRLDQAQAWLETAGVTIQSDIQRIADDASFRRYFRLQADGRSCVLMDAPPPAEDVRPFVNVCGRLRAAGLYAPEILLANPTGGFLLLEDLGDDLYRCLLNKHNADEHFPALFEVLHHMAHSVDSSGLARYSADKLRTEMNLFPEWYLSRHRPHMPLLKFNRYWDTFCDHVILSALEQPSCFVHRDFHSCNLMKTPSQDVCIIDFQDAVKGPVSYDFVSLVWDRYISWPRPQIESWMEQYRQLLGTLIQRDDWIRYCDLMGVQRNIKIVGIFARLKYRDNKTGYLEMIPRFYKYITETLSYYPEFAEILELMEQPECVP